MDAIGETVTLYVYYPRGLETGGPEAIHQLVDSLLRQGLDARLVAMPESANSKEIDSYSHYMRAYSENIEDKPENIVIVPEVAIHHLRNIKYARCMIWWLSVDNSALFSRSRMQVRRESLTQRMRVKFYYDRLKNIVGTRSSPKSLRRIANRSEHLAQSHYAHSYISSRFPRSVSLLTDYTIPANDQISRAYPPRSGPMTVAYNPAKDPVATRALSLRRPDIEWIPIEGMSREQVLSALRRATVYLDLGHHPGKDRMPREAAICGAIVVVGRRGSAANVLDLPVDDEFKIEFAQTLEETIHRVESALDRLAINPCEAQERQATYRSWIYGERDRFDREVRGIFIDNQTGSDVPGTSLDYLAAFAKQEKLVDERGPQH